MVSQPAVQDDTPPVISDPGSWTLETVSSGCKLWVTRSTSAGETEKRRAEVLSVRAKKIGPYHPAPADPADKTELYVHYVEFNKRLDEWIPGSRVILTKELEWPKPKPPPTKRDPPTSKKTVTKKTIKKASLNERESATPVPNAASQSKSVVPQKRPVSTVEFDESQNTELVIDDDMDEDAEGDADGDADGDVDPMDEDEPGSQSQPSGGKTDRGEETGTGPAAPSDPQQGPRVHSKKQEIEKLRTSGSMTQNVHEIARVKNLDKLQIGKHLVEAWYFSPYPVEFSHLPVLYVCEFCLSYLPSPVMFSRHRKKCQMLHPPGNEIYRHEDISFWELDGKKQLTWCRNLSLLSKCFLDHKTLYYDVQPFMYYIMTLRDSHGCHILGYFSKEKESAEGYNLACILTLPQHQRFGYGRLLIEFSYELSKREGKVGSPEKPLSDLGLISYRAYWAEKIVHYLLESGVSDVSFEEISHKTAITAADVHYTLLSMQMIKLQRNNHILCLTDAAKEAFEKSQKKNRRRINPDALRWKPPVFTRDQLRAWAY